MLATAVLPPVMLIGAGAAIEMESRLAQLELPELLVLVSVDTVLDGC